MPLEDFDDSLLVFRFQIRVHRQAEDSSCTILADWKLTFPITQKSKSGLEVQRFGIIDGRGNGGLLELIDEILPVIFIFG